MTGEATELAPSRASGERSPTPAGHAARIGLAMALAAALLGWLAAHTDILFADGLRYITQAQALDRGSLSEAIRKAVDHPIYPIAVVAVHRTLGGDSPEGWQSAAQIASILAAVLLVIPLYLVCRELFGDGVAFPACLLVFAVPLTGHVFADTLSESTFLFFWTWGLWGALRFLRSGGLGWLTLVVFASGLAYLTRPEGLLLPAAVVATLVLNPWWIIRGLGRRGLIAASILVLGSLAVVGPYVAFKGGIGTKPSIARLLGTAPKSAAHAVERQRPLEPKQSVARTYGLAAKAVLKAVTEAVPLPLLALAVVGFWGVRGGSLPPRGWTLLSVIGVASVLALVRLHATGGYCSPRHALVLALILIPAAAAGLKLIVDGIACLAARSGRFPDGLRPALMTLSIACFAIVYAPRALAPVNEGMQGYKDAGHWLARQAKGGGRVVDVTGWSQFYAGQTGYTFENLVAAPADPSARWVVVRESHLRGPWDYCKRIDALVEGLTPVKVFGGKSSRGATATRVMVFDRRSRLARGSDAPKGRLLR